MHHRLNGSSSPVLTATCLSYGRLCDFLNFFPQPTWRSHPSTDFDTKWLKRRGFTQGCAFCSKNRKNKPLDPQPPKRSKFGKFFDRKFALDFVFSIGVSRVNTPYSSSQPNKCHNEWAMWGWEFQICTQILHRGTDHVISRMRNGNNDLHRTGTLEPNISKTVKR